MKKLTWMGMAALLIAGMAATPTVQASMVVEPYTYGSGATAWTNTTAAPGGDGWSLELTDPNDGINYAGAKVTGLGDPSVKDFDGWSYWTRGPEFHGVNFWMCLDTPQPNRSGWSYDLLLGVMPYNMMGDDTIPGDTWVNLDSTSAYPYQVWDWSDDPNTPRGYDITMWPDGTTWSEFQALDTNIWGVDYDFGDAVVKMVVMRMGGGGHSENFTGYLDDFTLNGESHPMIPEPASLSLLGLGVLALTRRHRR